MNRLTTQSDSFGKTFTRRIAMLVETLSAIHAGQPAPVNLLNRFQTQYMKLTQEEKPMLFEAILHGMEIRKKDVEELLRELLETDGSDFIKWGHCVSTLRHELASPRTAAFRSFLNMQGGLRFLLDFRADLLAAQQKKSLHLELLDAEIAGLFNTWFQQGFLFLREITRDSSYRHIQFLKEHDMVHPMTSIDEMGSRLGLDHRCFALFHRAMPDEIIIFIEVALTKGITRSISEIIPGKDRQNTPVKKTDTAVFYSINNGQNGLSGLGLGKILIFQVVEAIRRDHPQIKTFATLSPITGLREHYLERILRGDDKKFSMKKEDLEALFSEECKQLLVTRHAERSRSKPKDFASALIEILDDSSWIEDEKYPALLKKPLTEAAYCYVAMETEPSGKPLNPVAGFHVGNGAGISRCNINFAANLFEHGVESSCGIMANYIYSESRFQQMKRTVKSLLQWHK